MLKEILKYVGVLLFSTVIIFLMIYVMRDKKVENTTSSTAAETNANTEANTETNNTPAQIEATEFKIQNLIPNTTIKSIYATVTGADTWTPNLLNGLELAYGTQAKIGLGLTEQTSNWQFKVTDEEGTEVTFSATDLSKILENKGGEVAFQLDENNQPVVVVK